MTFIVVCSAEEFDSFSGTPSVGGVFVSPIRTINKPRNNFLLGRSNKP